MLRQHAPYQASEAWKCSVSVTTEAICSAGSTSDVSGRMGRLPTYHESNMTHSLATYLLHPQVLVSLLILHLRAQHQSHPSRSTGNLIAGS